MSTPADDARRILASNLYMTLGTADAAGTPWVTPVFFVATDDAREVYWVSSPEARHSRNLEARAEVSVAVFDSKALVGQAEAVYMAGTAGLVDDDVELEAGARIYGSRGHGARSFAPEELRGDAELRLYRARIGQHWLLARAGTFERTVDGRIRVDPAGA